MNGGSLQGRLVNQTAIVRFGPEADRANRRGEAVSQVQIFDVADTDERRRIACADAVAAGPQWHALWTHSHCEQMVRDQLAAKGFEMFLPTIDVWSRRAGLRRRISAPMFSGYLFLRHAMDKPSYIEVRKTRGLVNILGESWDRLAVVPVGEIAAIQTTVQSRLPILPHAYLREGQRVRIVRGPLANVEGILVRQKPRSGWVVLAIQLLRQSVAVEVDCTWITAL